MSKKLYVTLNGKQMVLPEAAAILGYSRNGLYNRLQKMPEEEALQPNTNSGPEADWSELDGAPRVRLSDIPGPTALDREMAKYDELRVDNTM